MQCVAATPRWRRRRWRTCKRAKPQQEPRARQYPDESVIKHMFLSVCLCLCVCVCVCVCICMLSAYAKCSERIYTLIQSMHMCFNSWPAQTLKHKHIQTPDSMTKLWCAVV